jgi:hypothetical protein
MADYTTDSPATCVCAAQYTPVVGTVTAKRQVNGITIIDVTYVAQAGAIHSTSLRIPEGFTEAEIRVEIDAYGREWYLKHRWEVADEGTWYGGLDALINTTVAPYFPPSE